MARLRLKFEQKKTIRMHTPSLNIGTCFCHLMAKTVSNMGLSLELAPLHLVQMLSFDSYCVLMERINKNRMLMSHIDT